MNNSISDPFVYRPNERLSSHQKGAVCAKLSGKTLAVKDLFHISSWPTGAGNPSWLNSHPPATTTNSSINKLLAAGVEVVGKTHTDELAYSLNGQNMHYGTLLNPLAPDRLPGGSSSGSAVAVAAQICDIGLGTDTGGSIRVPASYNGIFGLRPTHGVIPMDNMVSLAPSFDTVGWFARSLSLMDEVARVLLPQTQARAPLPKPIALIKETLSCSQTSSDIKQWLNHNGIPFTIVTLDGMSLNTLGDCFRVLQGFEIWQTHGAWIKQQNPKFAPDIEARFQWCATISTEEYQSAKHTQKHLCETLLPILTQNNVVLPTTPGPAPLLSSSDKFLADYRNQLMCLTCIAGLSGTPQLHLPVFNIENAPAGLSLLGDKGEEMMLIQRAKTFLEDSR